MERPSEAIEYLLADRLMTADETVAVGRYILHLEARLAEVEGGREVALYGEALMGDDRAFHYLPGFNSSQLDPKKPYWVEVTTIDKEEA